MRLSWIRRRRHGGTAVSQGPFYRRLAGLLAEQRITLVLDVGANEGQFARALLDAGYDGRIVSVEPHPETHARLVRRARGSKRWRVAPPLALGDREGTAELMSYGRSDMNSLLRPGPAMGRAFGHIGAAVPVPVPVARLDRLWPELAAPDDRVMLKLDTQGSEDAVLAGTGDYLDRLAALQCEAAVTPLYEGQPRLGTVIQRLAALGFEPALVSAGHWSWRISRELDLDVVFVPVRDGQTSDPTGPA